MPTDLNMDDRLSIRDLKTQSLEELDINDIQEGYRGQPSIYARYGFLWAKARERRDQLESQTKKLIAELRLEIRKKYPEVKQDDQRAMVASHKKLKALELKKVGAAYRVDILVVILDALSQRKDMLISYGAGLRQEFDSDISLLKKRVERKMRKARNQPRRKS